jgi:hypothetical protein
MNNIFYHIYLFDKIDSMVINQLNRLKNSGLLNISELHVIILNNPEYNKSLNDNTLKLINELSKNIYHETNNYYEIITHKKIFDHAQLNDSNYLYMHTKGCTRVNHQNSGSYSYHNIENWRHMQEYFTIDMHKYCLDGLKTHDIVGSNYVPQHIMSVPAHYSGGFWWSKSEFIRKLQNPQLFLNEKNINRFHAEFWLGYTPHKALCLYPIPEKNNNNQYSQHRGFSYCDETIYKNNIIKNTYINTI